MIFNICFLVKTLIDLSFLSIEFWPPLLLSLLFYFLTVHKNSICSNIELTLAYNSNRRCLVCNHNQILRMKHCEICNRCIHKYDHHCKLMQVCIGEFNHKYYIGFLLSYILSQLFMNFEVLMSIRNQVVLDQNGIQKVGWRYYVMALQLCVYGLAFPILCFFLIIRHLRLISRNLTTWQEARWSQITYLQNCSKILGSPFSKGFYKNIISVLKANRDETILWQLPLIR